MSTRKKGFLCILLNLICPLFVGCAKQAETQEAVELAQTAMKNYTIQSEILEEWGAEPEVLLETGERLCAYVEDEENRLYCFVAKEDKQYFLRVYAKEGTLITEQDITEKIIGKGAHYFIDKTIMDKDGILYVMSAEDIVLFRKDGGYMGRVEVPTVDLRDMGISKEGKAFVTYYRKGDTGQTLATIDAENGKTIMPVSIPGNGKLFTGTVKGIFVYDSQYLYEVDTTTGKCVAVLDLMRHYITADYIRDITGKEMEEFDFIIQSTEGMNPQGNPVERIRLTYNPLTGDTTQEDKITVHMVNIGTEGNDPLADIIMEFNKQSDTYFVKNELLGIMGEEELAAYVNTRMVSEECPDLLMINYFYYQTYAEAGVLEDLNSYLTQSTLLSTDNYLETALEPFRVGEALYGVPKGFNLRGLVGRKSQVKKLYQHMTVWDFVEFLEKNSSAVFQYNGTPNGILEMCLKFGMEEFVDYEKGVCDFEGEGFRRLMERINRMERTHDAGGRQWEELLDSEEILLEDMMLSKIFGLEERSMEYGEDLLFLGYPSVDGKLVCEIRPQDTIGITKNSKEKDGAWEFLKYYLLNYELVGSMPTEKHLFEKEWIAAKTPKYEKDEDGELVEQPVKQVFVTRNDKLDVVPAYALSEEKADYIREAVQSARPVKKETDILNSIIWEESNAYFYGDKTLDETLRIIQNRCQLYLDENTN